MVWHAAGAGGPFSSLNGFAESLGLVNAVEARHGKLFWTYAPAATAIDHVLVSKQLATSGGVVAAGVWQGAQLNNSDHRMVAVQLDVTPWLKLTMAKARLTKPPRKAHPARIRLDAHDKVLTYQQEVLRLWDAGGLESCLAELQQRVNGWWGGGGVWGEPGEDLLVAMDDLMTQALGVLDAARQKAFGGSQSGSKVRAKRKQPGGPEARLVTRRLMALHRIRNDALQGHRGWARRGGIKYRDKYGWEGIGVPDHLGSSGGGRPGRKEREWQAFLARVDKKLATAKKTIRRSSRERWRQCRDKGRAAMLKTMKEGKMKAVYSRIFKQEAAELDRSCVVEGEGEERVVHTTPEAVGKCQRDFFRKWFREGDERCWFIEWGERGEVVWTHTLYELTPEGRARRHRLVTQIGLSAEEQDADFGQFMDGIRHRMPEDIWWTLDLLAVKELKHLGRRVCEADYEERGVMQPITEEVWDNYWGGKKRNKAADKDGTTANMFIALMCEVPNQETGRKGVLTHRQFDVFRMLLDLVVETGAVYRSWAPEVLLTVPKVVGSEAMADVRPLGLLIILRNAFFGIQFKGVKRTQHELGVLAQNQYGGLKGLGTEGCRLVQNCAYEMAWMQHRSAGGGNEDKEHAFDTPPFSMYQCTAMRLALPMRLLKVMEQMMIVAEVHVRNGWGYAAPFVKMGEGGPRCGAVQGSEDGPDQYDMLTDVFNSHWEAKPMGVKVAVSEQLEMAISGVAYLDDCKPIAGEDHGRTVSAELTTWYQESGAVGKLVGAIAKPAKCVAHVAQRGDGGKLSTNSDIEKVLMPVGDDMVEITMVEGDVAVKTLGELNSPGLCWATQLGEVTAAAWDMARALRTDMPAQIAINVWETVFIPIVVYRLLFATCTEAEIERAVRPAFKAFKAKVRCGMSAPTKLLQAFGIGELWHRLKVDRLLVLLRCLNSHREMLRNAARAMLHMESLWESTQSPILSVPHCTERG